MQWRYVTLLQSIPVLVPWQSTTPSRWHVVLANALSPQHNKKHKQHVKDIATRCETGIWHNGTVVPQVQTTEHIHVHLQGLGYTTPEQIVGQGTAHHQSRCARAVAASIYFLSQEAVVIQRAITFRYTRNPNRKQLKHPGTGIANPQSQRKTCRVHQIRQNVPYCRWTR